MKFTAFILSFYFLLISAQPVLAGLAKSTDLCNSEMSSECCESKISQKECERREKSGNDQQSENDCPLCCYNAFQCTFCCGALVEETTLEINSFAESKNQFSNLDLVHASSYSSDCWQPPELI